MDNCKYCVAIRTLGTAGEKYQLLLNSLNQQTIKPKKIIVYIPFGYELPKETIGWEEYVRCPKGMITQRSLPFDEIDTEYILFCDDDISLEPSSVERLFQGLMENSGDCISPNTFPVENMSPMGKIKKAISGYAFPRRNDGWAFKIMRNGGYTYNNHPGRDVLPSESAAFPCLLISKSAYKSIHFEDERWIEDFGYALGDDLLFFYKLYTMGFKVLVHYKAGVVHLDAGTASKRASLSSRIRSEVAIITVIQYRIKYSLSAHNRFEKFMCLLSSFMRHVEQFLFCIVKSVFLREVLFIFYLRGIMDGYKYIKSERYKKIPVYDAYLK